MKKNIEDIRNYALEPTADKIAGICAFQNNSTKHFVVTMYLIGGSSKPFNLTREDLEWIYERGLSILNVYRRNGKFYYHNYAKDIKHAIQSGVETFPKLRGSFSESRSIAENYMSITHKIQIPVKPGEDRSHAAITVALTIGKESETYDLSITVAKDNKTLASSTVKLASDKSLGMAIRTVTVAGLAELGFEQK